MQNIKQHIFKQNKGNRTHEHRSKFCQCHDVIPTLSAYYCQLVTHITHYYFANYIFHLNLTMAFSNAKVVGVIINGLFFIYLFIQYFKRNAQLAKIAILPCGPL